ncbi:glycoside hydrolase family 3 C-terminal domain-containing protein [Asticcacaulis sp. AC460]|uniref:glycoside hydrolase family 3 C-terminal domain-containing protein n=1 Tax=Asticcacaulis sp. AC460 TaxID=1282360 RepID=UPI00040094AF|nr:glycoside hydrolase family 3 C-terminal domain-containing protein [Asticcacaulis sp. AC460]
MLEANKTVGDWARRRVRRRPFYRSTAIASLALLLTALPALAADPVPPVIAKMTLDEKVSQLQAAAPAIPRLGVTKYNWWNEGLHGIARAGDATVFPQAIGLAATWDTDLLHAVGDTVATEARAKFNTLGADKDHGRYMGLTIWSPNINIFRDPRWGRGQETYGEDPHLTGVLGAAFVQGLQGPDPLHPKTIASVKHFAVHSGPEAGRHGFDVDSSPYDREATYLPAFRRVITEGKAQSVMCAYNALHGIPACASDDLLDITLRRDWKFDGFVVTDCDAVDDMYEFHFYRLTPEENAAEALKAGTDLNCGNFYRHLKTAVDKHLVTSAEVDQAVTRLWTARTRLGLDGVASPYGTITANQIHTPAAHDLALKAARESLVLLKNDGVLPLKSTARIAVIGPNADTLEILQANYHGAALDPVTPLKGLRTALGNDRVTYTQGASIADGVAIPIPETALSTGGQPGLTGQYFANPNFAGKPAVTRIDTTVNLDLYNTVPVQGFDKAPYSVRWSGYLTPPAAGDYQLKIYTERCWECNNEHDAITLYVDGQPVITDTGDGKSLSADLHFADTKPHAIRLDFRHVGQDWGVRLQWQAPAEAQIAEAIKATQDADAIVAFVGLSPDIEGEELSILVPGFDRGDRTDLALPARQEALLKALKATGKPLIVVNLSGGAVALNWADANANAVLQAWYPGESGGTAIAETLLGQNNPSGRLPVTFYKSVQDLPPFIDYRMTGRTYRYFKGQPLYAFGHGLSYTSFAYSQPRLSTSSVQAGQGVTVTATVTNTGKVAGDEVAQLYLTPPANAQGLIHSLVGFKRVHLEPRQSAEVTFDLTPRDLSTVDRAGTRTQAAGNYGLFVGGAQPSTDGVTLTITGAQALPK